MKDSIHQETTLKDYFRVIFKHKAVVITTIVVLMMSTYIPLNLYTQRYVATVKLMKEGEGKTAAEYYREFGARGRELNEVEIAKSSPIIERVVAALGLYNLPLDYEKRFSSKLKAFILDHQIKKAKSGLEKLKPEERNNFLFKMAVKRLSGSVSVQQMRDTNIFIISVSDFSPNGAIILANAISRSYVIFELERQLAEVTLRYGEKHSIVMQIKDKINELQKLLDGRPISDIEAIGPANVKILDQAKESNPVTQYNKRLILTLIFLLSIVLGSIFAFGFEFLNHSIKTPRDVETFLNIPFLGSIPKRRPKDKLLIENPDSTNNYTRFHQNLSNHLDLLIKDKKLRSILITDAESSEDTASVIANIGICLARKRADYKVLIIDANLRNPTISKVFNIASNSGLAEVLEGKISFEGAVKFLEPNLCVLTAGQASFNPATLLDSSMMSYVIKTTIQKYNIVLLSSADLKNFTDAVVLSSITDGTVIVINEGKVRRQIVKIAMEPVRQKANLIGVVLNNRNLYIPKLIYDRL